jgi:hypothetical protein
VTDQVAAAVTHLDATFAGYSLPAGVPTCEHCRDLFDPDSLAGQPLQSVPVDAIAHLAVKVATTWGGPDELRALLPRLCALAAAGTPRLPLRAVTTKLRHAGWLGWPGNQQEAVADFLSALWADVIGRDPGYHDAGGVLLAITEAVDNLHPFLATWHERGGDDTGAATRRPAITHLTRFVLGYQNELRHGRLPRQVAAWLRGPTTHILLDRATYDFAGSPLGQDARLSVAVLALAPP